jgi:hypothetical protein
MIGIKGNLGFASIEIVEAFGRDGASRNMKEFRPHLEILPPAQMRLWRELSGVPNGFVLYGGTALALRDTGLPGRLPEHIFRSPYGQNCEAGFETGHTLRSGTGRRDGSRHRR